MDEEDEPSRSGRKHGRIPAREKRGAGDGRPNRAEEEPGKQGKGGGAADFAPDMMHLHRNSWLIFEARRGTITVVSSLAYLAAVNVVIWAGLFFYLWRLDRRISGKEREP